MEKGLSYPVVHKDAPPPGWTTDSRHPRFWVKEVEGKLRLQCPHCGKQNYRTFEDLMHFSNCPTNPNPEK